MDYLDSPDFDSHAQKLLKDWHIPGLALAFVANGKVASKAFGYASLDSQEPCTPDSLFDMASCSKSFTAASVGFLVHDEENHPDLKWNTPMSQLLPDDFVMAEDEYTRGVTVEDILSHRSGIPGHDSSYLSQSALEPDTAASVTRNLRNLPITRPIRTKYQYCNMMFTVATHLVETRANMTFEEYLHKHIFSPLGMKSSHLFHTAATAAGLANHLTRPHTYNAERDAFSTIAWPVDPEAQGAGSICSSVNDMSLYVLALINNTGPFTPELLKDLTNPRIFTGTPLEELDPFASYMGYALGWEVYFYRGYQIVRHDGAINGFSSILFYLPLVQAGGVILGNSSSAGNACEILMKEFIDQVIGVPEKDRIDWPAQARKMYDEYETERENELSERKKSLFKDGQTEPEPLTVPLEAYTGAYHNSGYHTLEVEVKDGHLFINAKDRSMGFMLSFEHICDQRIFLVKLQDSNDPEDTDEFRGEFSFEGEPEAENAKVLRMGLHLEYQMEDCIWFDRVAR